MEKFKKQTKGITLIALVITIIVLLILAGVSISMLSGDNSILQKATDARERTGTAQTEEKIKLAYAAGLTNGNGSIDKASLLTELQKEFGADKVTEDNIVESADGKKWTVTIDGATVVLDAGSTTVAQNPQDPETPTLPTRAGTKPFFPKEDGTWSVVDETDLSNGLVITDHKTDGVSDGNEYVWIEVPNKNLAGEGTISFTGPDYASTLPSEIKGTLTDDQRTEIKGKLISYVETLLNGSDNKTSRMGWRDEWYDSNNHIYDGEKWYKYDDSASTKYVEDTSYSGNSGDLNGCGLSYSQYNTLYDNMLKSVYNHGGFWIGRYEAGTTSARNKGDSVGGIIPLSKIDLYPIYFVTCSAAQQIASSVPNKGTYNSSLLFGIQWDCVLKYLNKRGSVSVADLTSNSESWGNYDLTYGLDQSTAHGFKGELSLSDYSTLAWSSIGNGYSHSAANWSTIPPTALSTGATTRNEKQNIYDLAGNVIEWTLEHATSHADFPCAYRGGLFGNTGSVSPASNRINSDLSYSNFDHGFRVSLY